MCFLFLRLLCNQFLWTVYPRRQIRIRLFYIQSILILPILIYISTWENWNPNPARTRDRLTRPDPTRAAQLNLEPEPDPKSKSKKPTKKKRKKAAFHDCMQRNRLIKALPFHKHLPVMKVCEHQEQRSHTFCRVYEFCMDKKIILPPCKLWSFFVSSTKFVSILSTLNQT